MKKTKKVNTLFLFHDTEKNNGANQSLIEVISTLTQNGTIVPYVALPKKSGTVITYLENKGFNVYKWRYGRWDYKEDLKGLKKIKIMFVNSIKLLYTIPTFFKLKKVIRDNNIEVVYTNTYTIFLGCLLKKYCNISHIWHIREFGKEDHGLKLIIGDKYFNKILNQYSDKIILISQSLYNKYKDIIEDLNKVEVLYNDLSENSIQEKKCFNENKKLRILIAGTLQEGKCQIDVIKAIKVLKEKNILVELNIAGKDEGEYFNKLKKYVEDNCLNDVVNFNGYIENMNRFRRKMDIGVVASSSEAFGRVTIEGMLSNMLIIGADAGATSELISDGRTGYLYEKNNYKELAELIEMLNNDRALLKNIAINGFEYAKMNFAVKKTSKRIGEIIKDLAIKENF